MKLIKLFKKWGNMIKIKDKKDSINKMKELRLNYFPLDVFDVKDLDGIKKFFDKYPFEEYVMRSPNKTNGNFFYVKNFEVAKEKLSYFSSEVTIDVSYRPYKEDIVLVGDIKVHRGLGADTVDLTARTDSDATQRNIYENPEYNMHTTIEDNKLWDIPGFSKIMRYITDHELYDVIVEFSVYDCKIGINKENVVISELRTAY